MKFVWKPYMRSNNIQTVTKTIKIVFENYYKIWWPLTSL